MQKGAKKCKRKISQEKRRRQICNLRPLKSDSRTVNRILGKSNEILEFSRINRVAKEREEFGRTQMPVKGPLRKGFQEGAVALPRNYGYRPDIPFHCLPVRPISLSNIRIKPFCHQQKPVLPLHTQRYRIGGMEKPFIICGYSKLVK